MVIATLSEDVPVLSGYENSGNYTDLGVYKYQYEGKEYIYKSKSNGYPEQQLKLYILDDPKNAKIAGEFGKSKLAFFKTFGIVYILFVIFGILFNIIVNGKYL